jgi:hypothetical protein
VIALKLLCLCVVVGALAYALALLIVEAIEHCLRVEDDL